MEALRFFTLQDYKYEIFLWYKFMLLKSVLHLENVVMASPEKVDKFYGDREMV